MANSTIFDITGTDEEIASKNSQLVEDIMKYCKQSDYKKHNVLLIGEVGSGKSSVVNTLLKVVIGKFIPRAPAGGGNVLSNTLQLKWYPTCGARKADFEGRVEEATSNLDVIPEVQNTSNEESFQSILDKLPDIFDAAGMRNKNTEETKEILRLLIGGYIAPNTNIDELEKHQNKKGVGYLSKLYNTSHDEYRISMVVFTLPCGSPIPDNLIKCIREVIEEVDANTLSKRYDIKVFLLLTKYDQVEDNTSEVIYSRDDSIEVIVSSEVEGTSPASQEGEITSTEPSITRDEFEKIEKAIADAFDIKGMEDYARICWANYNGDIGFDNPKVDNKSLQLLKFLTTPLHTETKVIPRISWLHKFKVDLKHGLDKYKQQHVNVSLPFLGACIILVFALLLVLSSSARRENK